MGNLFFDKKKLNILLCPERWHLVGGMLPPEQATSSSLRDSQWIQTHCHVHEHLEFMVALQGRCGYGYKNGIYRCGPGTIFIFNAGESHQLGYPPWTPPFEHLWISVMDSKIMTHRIIHKDIKSENISDLHLIFHVTDAGVTARGFSSLLKGRPEFSPGLTRAHLVSIIMPLLIFIVKEGYMSRVSYSLDSAHQQKIEIICQYLIRTLGKGIKIDDLAHMAGFSKYYFTRLFKRQTGLSIHQYLNECRVKRFKEWLAKGLPRKAIAAEMGFSCTAAFSRWARQYGK